MHPFALRFIVGVGSIGVAVLAILILEYTGTDAEWFAENARGAGLIGLALLVVLAAAHAVEWPPSLRKRMNSALDSIHAFWIRVRSGLRWSMLPRAIAIGLLLSASAAHERDFFVLLRWFVSGSAALTSVIAWRKQQSAWLWLGAMVTVLFNPLAQIELSRPTWAVIDPLIALWFAASILAVRERDAVDTPQKSV